MMPREQVLDVARQRLQLLRLLDHLGHLDELADQVRLVLHPTVEPDPLHALDEDPQRAVGDRGSACGRPRPCRSRAGRPSPASRRPRSRTVTSASIRSPETTSSTSCDRALLADRERRHRLREDDRLLQRENREGRGNLDLLLVDDELLLELAHRSPRLSPSTIKTRPAARLPGQRHHDRQQTTLVVRLGAARGRRPRRARHVAGTARTRSPSAGRRRGVSRCGRRRSPTMFTVRSVTVISTSSGSMPGRSTTTVTAGGSSDR